MITSETIHNLSLKKAFRGYDIQGVDDCLEQVERQLAQDTQVMEKLRGSLVKAEEEKNALRRQIEALAADRDDAIAAQHELQTEVDRLNSLVEQSAQDHARIEDSLMEIYRMREAIMKDAAEQADETQKAAEAALAQARDKADQMIMEAQAYKASMERECELLYQKISDFRATALEIYRRQMEAIKVFPERQPIYEISGPAAATQDADGKDTVLIHIEED